MSLDNRVTEDRNDGRTGRRRKFALIGCGSILGIFVLVIVLTVAVGMAADDKERPARTATRTAEEAAERRNGFHCLSAWDGGHAGMEQLIKAQLTDPNSLTVHETRIATVVVDSDGRQCHVLLVDFGARNAFGGMVRHEARGWVDHETCAATLEWVR